MSGQKEIVFGKVAILPALQKIEASIILCVVCQPTFQRHGLGVEGALPGTSPPLIPSLFLGCKALPRHLPFFPLPLWNWTPGSISLGYSAFSATDTSLSTCNLHKM